MLITNFKTEITLPNNKNISLRNATEDDATEIQSLYFEVYGGHYTLEVVTNIVKMKEALLSNDFVWFILEDNSELIGSIVFLIDKVQRLGKVFAAIVKDAYRGYGLTEKSINLGIELLTTQNDLIDLVYATTRTVSPAPQKLTERAGFHKLGIFPNVRKVINYETHALTAFYTEKVWNSRKKPVVLIPELLNLYNIIKEDLNLEAASVEEYTCEDENSENIVLEIIEAENFILNRFAKHVEKGKINMHFFPFHQPNCLLVSADKEIEVYIHTSKQDKHAVIIGGRWKKDLSYTLLLNKVSEFLENIGIRYIEMLVGAYKPKTIKEVLNARFLPSAYFPAMRLVEENNKNPFFKSGERLDYIVFSKSFEILDFKNLMLEGTNKDFLKYYFEIWKKLYIDLQ